MSRDVTGTRLFIKLQPAQVKAVWGGGGWGVGTVEKTHPGNQLFFIPLQGYAGVHRIWRMGF